MEALDSGEMRQKLAKGKLVIEHIHTYITVKVHEICYICWAEIEQFEYVLNCVTYCNTYNIHFVCCNTI